MSYSVLLTPGLSFLFFNFKLEYFKAEFNERYHSILVVSNSWLTCCAFPGFYLSVVFLKRIIARIKLQPQRQC